MNTSANSHTEQAVSSEAICMQLLCLVFSSKECSLYLLLINLDKIC